jgi:hypothetical protein
MRTVVRAFGEDAKHFVFLGGCALALYARKVGAPLRVTKDVDCISQLEPWVLQQKILADLCSRRVLQPDSNLQCRYRISGTEVDVDIISIDGLNVGGTNPWLKKAAAHARPYGVGEGKSVLAITPAYFLATKLVAFEDRGEDPQSSKDAEDIVTLAVEVDDLVAEVRNANLKQEVASLWAEALKKHGIAVDDLADLVDWHLHPDDRKHRARAVATLVSLARS